MSANQLTEQTLRQALGAHAQELAIHLHKTLDSTNTEAKRLAHTDVPLPALIVAEEQTNGRGRMGRSFFSPADTGVYFSLLYDTDADLRDAVTVTGAAAVCVMRAIRTLTGMEAAIKWVNDLYLGGKKVCGILAESVLCENAAPRLILGIGINLSTSDFPPELRGVAGSLGTPTLSRANLIGAILCELLPFLRNPTDRSWIADYKAHSMVLGRAVSWTRDGIATHGVALDIDGRGGLCVCSNTGEHLTLESGEISLRLD